MNICKRLLSVTLLLVMNIAYGLAQNEIGMGAGTPIGRTTPNPTQEKKRCSHCGIIMGNVTYAWQHETWCPYYKSQSSSVRKTLTVSQDKAIATVTASTVGSVLGNALSNWLNAEPNQDYKRYFNNVPGQTLGYHNDARTQKQVPEYVVLRDSKSGKLGVWKNAWTYVEEAKYDKNYGKATDYPGLWKIKPKYDFINLRYSGLDTRGLHDDCVAIVGLKSGKGDKAPIKYGLVEANEGWGYGHELIPIKYTSFAATTPKHKYGFGKEPERWEGGNLQVIFGNPDKDGKMVWGVWKVNKKDKPGKFDKMEAIQVMPETFEAIQIFDQHIIAWKDGRCGLYDREGKNLLSHDYASLKVSQSGLILAQKEEGGKYGVLNTNGIPIFPFEYESINICDGGTIVYSSNGLYGALLPDGQTLPIEYEQIDESFWTKNDGKKVVTLFVEKEGTRYYVSNGRLIQVHSPVNFEINDGYYNTLVKNGHSFSSWYEKKTANLKEEFMQKGEFEREADYQARIADPANQGKYLSSKLPFPQEEYLQSYDLKKEDKILLGKYDTEDEYFPLYLAQSPWNVVRIPVPFEAAQEFKAKWDSKYNNEHYELELRNDFPSIKAINIRVYTRNQPTTFIFSRF